MFLLGLKHANPLLVVEQLPNSCNIKLPLLCEWCDGALQRLFPWSVWKGKVTGEECPVLRQWEQSFSPHLVPSDSGRCIFSLCAWQGGPHSLNYPAVPLTPTPLFTQMKPQQIDSSDEGGNGLGPSCLFLYVPPSLSTPLSSSDLVIITHEWWMTVKYHNSNG